MINLIGPWSIAEIMQFDEEKGMVWEKASDLLAAADLDSDMKSLYESTIVFEEDGNMVMLSPIPEGTDLKEVDKAVASGEIELRDGMLITERKHWKVEDGKNWLDTGGEGEVCGEPVSPWEEIHEIGDSIIEFAMFRLKKSDRG